MSYFAGSGGDNKVVYLKDVEVPDSFYHRISTGSPALDQMIGGEDLPGIMPGCVILFSGASGAGKTTTQLQLAEHLSKELGKRVLYNIGEENEYQLRYTARRIGVTGSFQVSKFSDVEDLCIYAAANNIEVLFQDSLQSLTVIGDDGEELDGMPAWATSVKRIVRLSKDHGVTSIAAGHVTKSGAFLGRNGMKHDVDVHFEFSINKDTGNRVLELTKNRFGPANMPHEFIMTDKGMDFRPLSDDVAANLDGGGKPKQVQKKEQFVLKLKELLLAGHPLSGYSHEDFPELQAFGVSGGYMRISLQRATRLLEAEGHVVLTKTINRREHSFVSQEKAETV